MENDLDGGMEVSRPFANGREIAALNALIVACKDDGRAYRDAARMVSNPDRRGQMLVLSRRRSLFARELSTLVQGLGSSAARFGSGGAVAHRFARSLKIAFAGPHDGDVFSECARVAEAAAARYSAALQCDWPESVRGILYVHWTEIAEDSRRMRALRAQH